MLRVCISDARSDVTVVGSYCKHRRRVLSHSLLNCKEDRETASILGRDYVSF